VRVPRLLMSNIDLGKAPEGLQREQPRWALWLCGAGFVAAILVAAGVLSPYFRHQLALSVIRQTTPYTQLGFKNSAALPATGVRGKPLHISFVIINNEGKQVLYRYVVSSGSGSQLQPLSSSSETVASGATWSVDATVVPQCAESACRVQVSLPQQGESIDFLYQDSSPKKAGSGQK
jgi:hypothetical protein